MGSTKREISRREFGRRAAMGAATAALAPGAVMAVESTNVEPWIAPAAAGAVQDTKLSPESQAEADEKIAAIMRKYGSRFTEAQKADIRRLVVEGQKPLEAMRAFALDNADQPANVMRIYPDGAAVKAGSK